VADDYPPRLVGIQVDLSSGKGALTVELRDRRGDVAWEASGDVSSRALRQVFPINGLNQEVFELRWSFDEGDYGSVDRVTLLLDAPEYASATEQLFLFSVSQLSRCFDGEGLVADRGRWAASDYATAEGPGLFALAAAVGWDLGYVPADAAQSAAEAARAFYLDAPYHDSGLLPRHLVSGVAHSTTTWSTLHTVMGLQAAILAGQGTGLEIWELEELLAAIDWAEMTDAERLPIPAGHDAGGAWGADRLDTFGAEAAIAAIAYAASRGEPPLLLASSPPTRMGSGYEDELASVLFPMSGIDPWYNDWALYREGAFWNQQAFYEGQALFDEGLFGLSAGELTEPWRGDLDLTWKAWGVGGLVAEADDASWLVGYPIVTPHYAAMVAADRADPAEAMIRWLVEEKKLITPLNAVESVGLDWEGAPHHNTLQSSWSLALTALGAGRALSGGDYLPYREAARNEAIAPGLAIIMPGAAGGGL